MYQNFSIPMTGYSLSGNGYYYGYSNPYDLQNKNLPKLNEQLLDKFIFNKKNQNATTQNISNQPKENSTVTKTAGVVVGALLSSVLLDVLLAKGEHINTLLNQLKNTNLKNLAKLRVEHNVVKRNMLKFGDFRQDINKMLADNMVKKGECVNVFKASCVPKNANFSNLKLGENAVVMAKNDGTILKIYDTKSLSDDLIHCFSPQKPILKINI